MSIFQVRDQYGQIIDIPLFMGPKGESGADGKSAYDIAKEKGFVGTEEEWLLTLKGADGKDGKSGKDYILTDSDKQEIANMVPTPDVTGYATESYVDEKIGNINSILATLSNGGVE